MSTVRVGRPDLKLIGLFKQIMCEGHGRKNHLRVGLDINWPRAARLAPARRSRYRSLGHRPWSRLHGDPRARSSAGRGTIAM